MYVERFLSVNHFDVKDQDYTHPAAYYQPIFDVPEDHGTVRTPKPFPYSIVTVRAEPYLNYRPEWNGCGCDLHRESHIWLTSHGSCHGHFIQ